MRLVSRKSIVVVAAVAVAAATSVACSRGEQESAAGSEVSAGMTKADGSAPRSTTTTILDFATANGGCTFGHRGVLLDFGDVTMNARMSGTSFVSSDFDVKEHEGASWASVRDRAIEVPFVSAAEMKADNGTIVEARVRGGGAKSISVFLDGKSVGVLPLAKSEARVVTAKSSTSAVVRGENLLSLRMTGAPRGSNVDHLAQIDWIRIGPYDGDAPYAAPTRADVVSTVTIGGLARRGVSLRAPGFARCTTLVPRDAVLEGYVGAAGGEADAEVRVVADRGEPRVVGSFHVGAGEAPGWQPVSIPLGTAGTIASVELVAKGSTKGARVVFGEARVVVPAAADVPKIPAAKGVVVVVLGSTAPRALSLNGGTTASPELAELASSGTVFEAHRATSSFASGSIASTLTGLLPRAHGVEDGEGALRSDAVTIAQAAREGGVVTAMFTANPTTSSGFGFARGWETFKARTPSDEAGAVAVFDDAAAWIGAHRNERFLVVIHARGGHPPWDITSDALKVLPPSGYTGALEPKHAAEMLAKARRTSSAKFFADADRERAFALYDSAVRAHDAALGKLSAHLKAIGRADDTTWIVTGDVGVDLAAHVPFLEDDAVDEGVLSIPLVVKAPGGTRQRVSIPTSSVDVATTALASLGLAPLPQMRGDDLWALAGGAKAAPRPTFATTATRFSARWGTFVMLGARERETRMCNLSLEPECISDIRATHPIATEAMHGIVFGELGRKSNGANEAGKKRAPSGPRATIDADLGVALRLWGR